MTALSDAERAVAEARSALIRRLHPWTVPPGQADEITDALIAAVRHHDAEKVRDFAEQEDRRRWTTSATVYIHGIRAAADRLHPEWIPEVEVRFAGGPTIRVARYSVMTDATTGLIVVEGFIASPAVRPPSGDAVRIAYLGIPGRGALADITARVDLFSRLKVPHIRIRVMLDPKATP